MDDAGPSDEVVATLVAGHREFLAFLERRVGDRALAEDLLQEAFTRGLDHAAEVRDQESVRAWFYRVLRNAVIDHHRRRGAASRALDAFAAELPVAEAPAELDGAVCRCVARLAESLKPEYAEALRRVEIEGLPVKDFAAQAQLSASNAAVRVFRARAALRAQVARACGTCAEHGCLDCSCKV